MNKIMTVDILSSIKNAKPSEAVNQLFEVIKSANTNNGSSHNLNSNVVSIDDLRADEVLVSSELERQIIIENFPKEKNGYLAVSRVIEE